MVVPVVEFELPYKDVYTLDYEFGPPAEVRGQMDWQKQEELARRLGEPKVMHKLRLDEQERLSAHDRARADRPRQRKLLAQSTMTYTSAGGDVDLPVTAAVDIKAKRTDKETGRTPDAVEVARRLVPPDRPHGHDRDHELQGQAGRGRGLARDPRNARHRRRPTARSPSCRSRSSGRATGSPGGGGTGTAGQGGGRR